MNPTKIVGADGNRHKNDFYPTPPECTIALLEFLRKHNLIRYGDNVWEPACGNGAMVNVLQKKGYDAFGTDVTEGYDYLKTDFSKECDWIITNPPFSLAKEFIERSLLLKKPFALLLKSQYWHSARRYELFEKNAPNFVLPLTWRPDFTGKGNSLLDMMWCVWIYDTTITYYQPLKRPNEQQLDDDQMQMIF